LKTLRSAADLAAAGLIAANETASIDALGQRYAIALTPILAAQAANDLSGPVAKQYVPNAAELVTLPEERADPIGDDAFMPVKGVVHRYPDRVLLKPIHACPVYCRFCFRREMVGPGGDALNATELDAALDYIRKHPAIFEVILTGGDPLMLSPRRLHEIVAALDAMAHVGVIRIHTRVPLAAPDLITDELVASLGATSRALFITVHCNHADELATEPRRALALLADAGLPLLSQSVLLRGVNDSVAALDALFRELVKIRVKPYYLHQADLAPGTGHFRVPLGEARAIVAQLRGRLSGIAVPHFVIDIPGGHGKVPVTADYMSGGDAEGWVLRDPSGALHAYPSGAP
jgi:lysine 2,3-aminomutase